MHAINSQSQSHVILTLNAAIYLEILTWSVHALLEAPSADLLFYSRPTYHCGCVAVFRIWCHWFYSDYEKELYSLKKLQYLSAEYWNLDMIYTRISESPICRSYILYLILIVGLYTLVGAFLYLSDVMSLTQRRYNFGLLWVPIIIDNLKMS